MPFRVAFNFFLDLFEGYSLITLSKINTPYNRSHFELISSFFIYLMLHVPLTTIINTYHEYGEWEINEENVWFLFPLECWRFLHE